MNHKSGEMEKNMVIMENYAELSIIQSKIYEIRGQKVMLDFDLAERYEIETKRLKEAVRRNINRFLGNDFMFQLSNDEIIELSRSQIATLNKGRGGNIKYPPFAFTELGVAMLSSVLNSEKAIEINKEIMRAFVFMRRYALTYSELKHELNDFMRETKERLDDHDMKFEAIFKLFDEFIEQKQELEKPRKQIGFKQK